MSVLRRFHCEVDIFCFDRLPACVLSQPVGFLGQFGNVCLCLCNKCSGSIAADSLSAILLCNTYNRSNR